MKTILVTVSDDRSGRKNSMYEITQQKIVTLFKNNPDFGITDFHTVTWIDIEKSEFYEQNKILLSNIDPSKNGRAYKPWAIVEALKLINEGDYLIYNDCSPEMWDDWEEDENLNSSEWLYLDKIKSLCDQNRGVLTAFVKWDTRRIPRGGLGIHTHENFTLDRCMKVMRLEHFANTYMGASGMIVIKKSSETVFLMRDWLHYCSIDECSCLGKAEDPNDFSFWEEEQDRKKGARGDQSILGLLLCAHGYKMVNLPRHDYLISPYCFLNFCLDKHYEFTDPNQNPTKEETPRIKKGDKVINKAGIELTVFEIWNEHGEETYHVGIHRESLYKTTLDQIKLK